MGPEMGPLGSQGTTSYRLPILTIGLSLIVFAVQTNGQTDGIGLAKGGTICTKVHRPPKSGFRRRRTQHVLSETVVEDRVKVTRTIDCQSLYKKSRGIGLKQNVRVTSDLW